MDEASVFQKIHTDALDKLADANIITGYFRDRIKELLNNKKDFPKGRKYVLDLLAMEHDLQNMGKKRWCYNVICMTSLLYFPAAISARTSLSACSRSRVLLPSSSYTTVCASIATDPVRILPRRCAIFPLYLFLTLSYTSFPLLSPLMKSYKLKRCRSLV